MALILLLCPESLSGFTESSRIVHSEVTVPRRLEAKDRTFPEGDTSYVITAEGTHHIVHLTQAKNLIAKDIPVFTYGPEGDLITEFPHIQLIWILRRIYARDRLLFLKNPVIFTPKIEKSQKTHSKTHHSPTMSFQAPAFSPLTFHAFPFSTCEIPLSTCHVGSLQDDCYYQGFVEGSPGSVVSLSTCFGISGVLQIGDLRYEIEPVENSSTFQHRIYRRALEGGSRRLCQVPEERKDHLPEDGGVANGVRKILDIEEVPGLQSLPLPTRYLELALITNEELFKVKNYNETLMFHLFISISNLLNTVYKRMRLQIVVSAVEMWTRMDQVTPAQSLARTLQGFAAWRQREAAGRINYDHIQLLLGQHYKERGFAWKGTMCQTNSMGVISKFPGHDTISDMMTLAHEIGHSLGFSHDDAKQFHDQFCDCNCTRRGCIMRTSPGSCLAFSNCTMGEYYNGVTQKNLPCLLNIPSLKPFLLELCGNGVLEKAEECDCGSDKACLQERCCISSSCLLAPGASCFRGECCHRCRFQPAGKICRENKGICDLPEYCNGSSGTCPTDVFKQDGTLCGDNDRCYGGHCHNHEAQCKALFGKAALRAPWSCFREVNARGDRCGNCGWNGTYYTKCLEENVLCGRVQCANIKRVPVRQDGETVVQTAVNDQLCWGLDFHLPPGTPDEGSVKDGTSCGRNKICMNRTCVSAAFLNNDCREKKCNGRGVCNNKKNCHCDFGWAPPDCMLEGFGGSVDSGPPPPFNSLYSKTLASKQCTCRFFNVSQDDKNPASNQVPQSHSHTSPSPPPVQEENQRKRPGSLWTERRTI
ncbi:disintegrin and metalloproteinase domain-containing protein 21-like [Rhynochetos jubatus]